MDWGICMQSEIKMRITGYVLSLIFTLLAYFIMVNPAYFHFDANTAVSVIFSLAMLQFAAQLIFFINVWKEKGPLWNLNLFLSTLSVVFVVVFFSIWIMNHLNYNMH